MLLCFAVLILAAFSCTQAKSPSQYNHNRDDEGFRNNTRCSWNCTVIYSDFAVKRSTDFAVNRIIRLVVNYKTKVDEKCVNHASRISSKNGIEVFKLWLPEKNKLSIIAHEIKRSLDLIFQSISHSAEESEDIEAVCRLWSIRSVGTTWATAPRSINRGFLLRFVRGYLANQGVQFGSRTDCNTDMDNSPPCIISKSTDSHFANEKGWPDEVILFFFWVFMFAFTYYSPAILCLFSPTEVTENDVRLIVLEGASPVGFRSLLGNCFHPRLDTFWHKSRTLVARLVLLPVLFLTPAVILDYMLLHFNLLQLSMIIFYPCYAIQALYGAFSSAKSRPKAQCRVCQTVKPDFTCKDILPRRILNHLRMQPLIIVRCWRLFLGRLESYFKLSTIILSSWNGSSIMWIFRIPILIIFLSTIPAVIVILLVIMLAFLVAYIFLTSPIVILCNPTTVGAHSNSPLKRLLVCFVRICITIAIIGAVIILLLDAFFFMAVIVTGFRHLLSEDSPPLVACFVLVLYYLWSTYSSFTNKYHDLSLTLYKCYKTAGHGQISNEALITDPEQENTLTSENKSDVVRIPKGLFDMACEELMPIREGVCIFLLKFLLFVSFVFLTFLLTIRLNVGATPVMKALVTFFTGLFPKIVAMYFDGGRQKRLQNLVIDEVKAPRIVQDYINGTVTPRDSQGQDNYDTNTDEVILADDNEENIVLVNT